VEDVKNNGKERKLGNEGQRKLEGGRKVDRKNRQDTK
jgi:hypothetical protein